MKECHRYGIIGHTNKQRSSEEVLRRIQSKVVDNPFKGMSGQNLVK